MTQYINLLPKERELMYEEELKHSCKKCNPEQGECDFCPHSSAGRLNLNERMNGDD